MITSTPKLILQFIEGNIKMLGDKFGAISDHTKEQVLYRSQVCKNDCIKRGYCVHCGCSVPGKMYVVASCNKGSRFPDLMDLDSWEKYKNKNNIKIEVSTK